MFRRLFRRESFDSLELTFLSKEDCHLCDEALVIVEQVRRKHPFALRIVKITPGDEWYKRYWDSIPVGLVDGGMIFKYRVTAEELLRKLRARTADSKERQ